MGLLDLVRKVLVLNAQIHGHDVDAGGNRDRCRSEVQNFRDPTGDPLIGHSLNRLGGHAQEAQTDLVCGHGLAHGIDRGDLEPLLRLANLAGIVVEDRHDVIPRSKAKSMPSLELI